MPEPWMPGVTVDPGLNAGYNAGRSSMDRTVAHYTVGSDSRGIARRGFFHFLVHQDAAREGGCTQYAEIDAITWHAGDPGNAYGPGIEFERNVTGGLNDEGLSEAEPLTPNQIAWGRRIVDYLVEWGIPAVLYDGVRYGGGNWRGWINHKDLDKDRSDGLTRAEWGAICGAPVSEEEFVEVVEWGDTFLQFSIDAGGVLRQSTFHKDLSVVALDQPILSDLRPFGDVDVQVQSNLNIFVWTERNNGQHAAIKFVNTVGWQDVNGTPL